MKRLVTNVALILASTLFALVASEIAFRAWLYNLQKEDVLAFERIGHDPEPRPTQRAATFAEIIRPTSNPARIYELKPDMVARFVGVLVETNSHGFRGPVQGTSKRENVLRIVGIGDSHMFGWGVRHEESFLSRVGAALNQATPGCHWEVINTAVPGYNTAMEVETLIEQGFDFSPDLVLVHYVGNDLQLPNFLPRDYWNPTRSYLLYFLYDRLRGRAYGREFLDYTPHAGDGAGFESDPALVPPEYRHIVGMDSYVRSMHKLRDLAAAQDFGVLVFTSFLFSPEIKDVLNELDLAYVQGSTAYSNYVAEHGGRAVARLVRQQQRSPPIGSCASPPVGGAGGVPARQCARK